MTELELQVDPPAAGGDQNRDGDVVQAVSDESIWRLATALSGAMTSADVASALAEEGSAVAGASFSNMAILDRHNSRVRVVHPSDMDPTIAARWSEFDLSEPTPLCEAMLSGLPVLLGSLEVMGKRYPDMQADSLAVALAATASFPLVAAGGAVIGSAGFGWPRSQGFGPEQVRRLDLIAHMAAQALERALLYQREREQALGRERADAQLIQDAFLPRVLPASDGLELFAEYLPASDAAMGGDWFDAFAVDAGVFLVIGDVAGHGLQSAGVMAQLRNTVRAYAHEDPSPARVLTRLNSMMCRMEPEETASAIVAVWDEASGTILRSNAGHPPVLRCRVGEFGFLDPPPGLLLGVDPNWVYEEEIKLLRPGTTLLFYTDGLIEMRGRSLEDGMESLRAVAEGSADVAPQAMCDMVLEWRRGAGRLEDDVCLLAARLTPTTQ